MPLPPWAWMAASTACERGLGRGVLGHVGGLPRGQAVVVQPGGLVGHQRGQLGLDLRLGQRVRDALVGADRPSHTRRVEAYSAARRSA